MRIRIQKCPECGKQKEIPYYLKKCFDCSYPEFTRYFWDQATAGDPVYLSGNITPMVTENGISYSSNRGVEPHAYGPHKIYNVKSRSLINSRGITFFHQEDTLLCEKGGNNG